MPAPANIGKTPDTTITSKPAIKVDELKITPLARRSDDTYMRTLRFRRA